MRYRYRRELLTSGDLNWEDTSVLLLDVGICSLLHTIHGASTGPTGFEGTPAAKCTFTGRIFFHI